MSAFGKKPESGKDQGPGKTRRPAAYPALPAGYDLCGTLDMAEDKDVFKKIAWSSLLAAAAMVVCGLFAVSPTRLFALGGLKTALAVFLTAVGLVVYVFAHEWVHGVFIRIFTGEPARFGFKAGSGMAYAKSAWFFSRPAYITVALAPVLFWGAVLAVLMGDAPEEYFWCLYAVQIFNVSGAAGDLYVTWLVMKMPAGVLAYDEGTSMKFFAPVSFE